MRACLLIVAALIATDVCAESPPAPEAGPVAPAASADVPLEEIRTFAAIFRAVKGAYVEPVDDAALMRDAIRGLLSGLDPHSEFLDARAFVRLDEQTTGEYAGLGVEVLYLDGALRVIAPIDDTPASRAGVRSGDVIERIDGRPVTEEDGSLAVQRLRGKAGSEVALTIRREGVADPLELTLEREVIRVASVRVERIAGDHGYVRISQFQAETGGELRAKLRRLQARGAPLRGLLLDLRSNPGGLLEAAVAVSDAFLDEGLIVETRGRLDDAASRYAAQRGDLLGGAPIVVLIDEGTASAAEIVAGALKDHRRALVVGRRSFGKGSVQSVLPLDSGDAVKLTTARYYTPDGVSIQAAGITPDITVPELRLVRPDGPASVAGHESDLPGHLAAEIEIAAGESSVDDPFQDDYVLHQGLTVLRGLAITREQQARARPAKAVEKG